VGRPSRSSWGPARWRPGRRSSSTVATGQIHARSPGPPAEVVERLRSQPCARTWPGPATSLTWRPSATSTRRQGPDGHHRRPLGPGRRRSRPAATRPDQRRRLRHLLDLAPDPRTPPNPPDPLPRSHPGGLPRFTPEEPHPFYKAPRHSDDLVSGRCRTTKVPTARRKSTTAVPLSLATAAHGISRSRPSPSNPNETGPTPVRRSSLSDCL